MCWWKGNLNFIINIPDVFVFSEVRYSCLYSVWYRRGTETEIEKKQTEKNVDTVIQNLVITLSLYWTSSGEWTYICSPSSWKNSLCFETIQSAYYIEKFKKPFWSCSSCIKGIDSFPNCGTLICLPVNISNVLLLCIKHLWQGWNTSLFHCFEYSKKGINNWRWRVIKKNQAIYTCPPVENSYPRQNLISHMYKSFQFRERGSSEQLTEVVKIKKVCKILVFFST